MSFFRQLWYVVLLLTFSVFSLTHALAQEEPDYKVLLDDILYLHARDLGFSGEPGSAREALSFLIARNPAYYDAHVLMARLYAWEREFDLARDYIGRIITHEQCYHEALAVRIDIEIWDANFKRALEEADKALDCHPGDELFLLKKASAFFLTGNYDGANEILDSLLENDPDNPDALELERQMAAPNTYHYRENNYLLAGYYGEFHREPFSRRMHIGTVGYSHYTGRGPLTGKLNFANTYINGTGLTRHPSLQYEVESYPRLSPEWYLFMNYAFSTGRVFPRHRGAFEIFRDLPRGFETSLGIRFLHWDRSYMFYTASAGKYYSDLWFSVRTWLLPGDEGLASSWYFNGRKYFRTADEYAGLIAGFGFSPDETLLAIDDRLHLRSYSTGIEFSRGLGPDYLVRGSVLYGYEEYLNGSWRNRWTFNLGLRYYL